MKNLRDTCIEYLKNETTKKDMREIIKPIFGMIYNEVYIYVWILAVYNIFFIVMILAMFIILLKLLQKQNLK